jgi:hypothetical protein
MPPRAEPACSIDGSFRPGNVRRYLITALPLAEAIALERLHLNLVRPGFQAERSCLRDKILPRKLVNPDGSTALAGGVSFQSDKPAIDPLVLGYGIRRHLQIEDPETVTSAARYGSVAFQRNAALQRGGHANEEQYQVKFSHICASSIQNVQRYLYGSSPCLVNNPHPGTGAPDLTGSARIR